MSATPTSARATVSGDVDAYVASCPEPARGILTELRDAIGTAVPDADEAMRYRMPTFLLDGRALVHIAAWKHHIGVYPLASLAAVDRSLEDRLAPYRTSKGVGRFPLDRPVPHDLIARMVAFTAEQERAGRQAQHRTPAERG